MDSTKAEMLQTTGASAVHLVFPAPVEWHFGRSLSWGVKLNRKCCNQFKENMYIGEWILHLVDSPRCKESHSFLNQVKVNCPFCKFDVEFMDADATAIRDAWTGHLATKCIWTPPLSYTASLKRSTSTLGLRECKFIVETKIAPTESHIPVPLPPLTWERISYHGNYEVEVQGDSEKNEVIHPFAGVCWVDYTMLWNLIASVMHRLWPEKLAPWSTRKDRVNWLGEGTRKTPMIEVIVFLYYTLQDVAALENILLAPMRRTIVFTPDHSSMWRDWKNGDMELTTVQETVILYLGHEGGWFKSYDLIEWDKNPCHEHFRTMAVPCPRLSSLSTSLETPVSKRTRLDVKQVSPPCSSSTTLVVMDTPMKDGSQRLLTELPSEETATQNTHLQLHSIVSSALDKWTGLPELSLSLEEDEERLSFAREPLRSTSTVGSWSVKKRKALHAS